MRAISRFFVTDCQHEFRAPMHASHLAHTPITNHHLPKLHAKTDLGRVTRQCSDAGLPNPGSSDLVGKVLVLASYTEEFRGRTERKYDVLATVGSAEDFDLERGIAIVQDEALASKQQVSASY